MAIRKEVIPFLISSFIVGLVLSYILILLNVNKNISIIVGSVLFVVLAAYMLYFFRDPKRVSPAGSDLIIAPADGVLAQIKEVDENKYLNQKCLRVSIFLSLFNVHVNRAPISGKAKFLGYFPGKRYFTFQEKSSDFNQHNAIIFNGKTKCLLYQIVGPVCRRVVYWPSHTEEVDLKVGDKIGMMKFGSRLDMYFPINDIELTAKIGDKMVAGITVMGKIKVGKKNED